MNDYNFQKILSRNLAFLGINFTSFDETDLAQRSYSVF